MIPRHDCGILIIHEFSFRHWNFFFLSSWIKCVGFPLNDIENWHWPRLFELAFFVWFYQKNFFKEIMVWKQNCPSSEIRGLCLMKWPSEMLQNLPYENPSSFFRFSFCVTLFLTRINTLVYVDIGLGIHRGKY